jgi:hypothetical protein
MVIPPCELTSAVTFAFARCRVSDSEIRKGAVSSAFPEAL